MHLLQELLGWALFFFLLKRTRKKITYPGKFYNSKNVQLASKKKGQEIDNKIRYQGENM